MKMIKREIEKKFKESSNSRKIVLITGARQVGKSTFVKSIKEKNRTYITLNDLSLRELAQNDPKLFLMNYKGPIIIDEIQYAPNLFPYIKMEADESNEKGKYWLTGSQKFELMKNVSESLAGRVSILEMSSLSFSEKKGFNSPIFDPTNIKNKYNILPDEIFKNIYKGGMPEYINDELERNQFFNDYLLTYLERDVRAMSGVGDLTRFRKFLIAVAARNGEVLNYNSLCEDADIDAKTAKNWISILEASDIIYLLKPYFSSELKRSTKAPKIVFLDTGLCSYLCGWNTIESLINSSTSGHYLETFVISELIKNKRNNLSNLNYNIYFYRDRDGKEIDLIIELNNVIYPFEINKTAKPEKSMISNFKVLENTNLKIGNGGLLCFYPNIIPLDEKNKSYPISVIF
jgi:hypothetical protein